MGRYRGPQALFLPGSSGILDLETNPGMGADLWLSRRLGRYLDLSLIQDSTLSNKVEIAGTETYWVYKFINLDYTQVWLNRVISRNTAVAALTY